MNKHNDSENTRPIDRLWPLIRQKGVTIVLFLVAGALVMSSDFKAFVLQQLMVTGIFNAGMDDPNAEDSEDIRLDFAFMGNDGVLDHTLNYRGQVIFINFWASWCPPCRAEFPSIEKLYQTFKEHPNVFFMTINEDRDSDLGSAFLTDGSYTVPMFRSSGPVPDEIYSGTLPTTVVLDQQGRIRYHHTGLANYASEKFINQIADLAERE